MIESLQCFRYQEIWETAFAVEILNKLLLMTTRVIIFRSRSIRARRHGGALSRPWQLVVALLNAYHPQSMGPRLPQGHRLNPHALAPLIQTPSKHLQTHVKGDERALQQHSKVWICHKHTPCTKPLPTKHSRAKEPLAKTMRLRTELREDPTKALWRTMFAFLNQKKPRSHTRSISRICKSLSTKPRIPVQYPIQ